MSKLKKLRPDTIFKKLSENPPAGVTSIELIEDHSDEWLIRIEGPDGSPYANGIFEIYSKFTKTYPYHPPKIKFRTCIYHMNITSKGHICIPIFPEWKSYQNSIEDVIEQTLEVLSKPDFSACVNLVAGDLYHTNTEMYKRIATQWTKKFAVNVDNPITFEDGKKMLSKMKQEREKEKEKKDDSKENENNKENEKKEALKKFDIEDKNDENDKNKEINPMFMVYEALIDENDNKNDTNDTNDKNETKDKNENNNENNENKEKQSENDGNGTNNNEENDSKESN